MSKKPIVASFVEGKKATPSKRPKSLTPKVKASDDKVRAGRYGKPVSY